MATGDAPDVSRRPLDLAEVVACSHAVGATSSKTAKRTALADLLRRSGDDVALVVDALRARPRQRRTGVSYRTLVNLPAPAGRSTLVLREVDATLTALERACGTGSASTRRRLVDALFARATDVEQTFLRQLLTGELRQGALDGVMLEAIADAFAVPAIDVRRAAMLSGSPSLTAQIAARAGRQGLADVGISVGVPVLPMLAASAETVSLAMTQSRDTTSPAEVVVDAKVDGVRAQIHVAGDRVTIVSRTLDDMTDRLPDVVAQVRDLRLDSAILDGEVVVLDQTGRPRPFQETGARVASASDERTRLTLLLFDALHVNGRDLIDLPLRERLRELDLVAGNRVVRRIVTSDPAVGEDFFRTCVDEGYEGVVVKRTDAPYVAGRRGGDWIKVKPVRTVDLVVLGVEWGSGRRTGLLSNIHLGARDLDGDGFVMVGKTFKGMTDAMLTWQTQRFLELEQGRDGHVVWTRPEQVVEIAFDAVQRSRRYPGGVALRFARVLRYRDDKGPDDADTIQSLQATLPSAGGRPD